MATGWGWNDLQWDYGAPVSALTFNDNAARLTIRPDPSAPGATVDEWTPDVDYYTVDNTMTPAAEGQTRASRNRAPARLDAGARVGDRWRQRFACGTWRSKTRQQYMAAAFKQALRGRGILVSGAAVSRHMAATETATLPASGSSRCS